MPSTRERAVGGGLVRRQRDGQEVAEPQLERRTASSGVATSAMVPAAVEGARRRRVRGRVWISMVCAARDGGHLDALVGDPGGGEREPAVAQRRASRRRADRPSVPSGGGRPTRRPPISRMVSGANSRATSARSRPSVRTASSIGAPDRSRRGPSQARSTGSVPRDVEPARVGLRDGPAQRQRALGVVSGQRDRGGRRLRDRHAVGAQRERQARRGGRAR